jgi:hypothetical protein
MGKLCERPGCSDVAAMSYGFDVDRLLVWLAPRDPDADPMRAGGLCLRHADAMVVPRGWTLDDRREPTPRLFRSPPLVPEPGKRGRPRPRRAPEGPVTQLPLPDAAAPAEPADPDPVADAESRTVAEVTGNPSNTDPDATVAIPWLPSLLDEEDDLGGLLDAHSPLLARAFRGTDRPR